MLILFIKCLSSKIGQNFCMFKGLSKRMCKSRFELHGLANISREFNDLKGSK